MTLSRLVRSLVFGAALASSPLYSCGGDEEDSETTTLQYTVEDACRHLVQCYDSRPDVHFELFARNQKTCVDELEKNIPQKVPPESVNCLLECISTFSCTLGASFDGYCHDRCDGEPEDFCRSEIKQVSNDQCGSSPLYGRHLWEITECSGGYHMRKDCLVGMSQPVGFPGGSGWRGSRGEYCYGYFNVMGSQTSEMDIHDPAIYESLRVTQSGKLHGTFDPNARYAEDLGRSKVNEVLEQYGGYLFFLPSGHGENFLNAFVPFDLPFPNEEECRNSPYFVGNN